MSQRTLDITKQANYQTSVKHQTPNEEALSQATCPDFPSVRGAASWRRVGAIARNTFREAVRDRVLYNLVLFVLLITVCAVFVGELSAANETKIIVDLGLSASLVFGAFIAIFVGTALVYKEIERRTVYAIFSKPVGRAEFLLGKYLGLCATLLVNTVVMGIGIALALIYVRGGWTSAAANVFPAMLLIYLELLILVAITLLFSTFSSPTLSALLAFALFIVGHFSSDLRQFADSTGTPAARAFFTFLYYLLPNFSNHSFTVATAHGELTPLTLIAYVALYSLLYIAALLAAATLIFKHRNFK